MSQLTVACPHCHKLNRVPQERLGDQHACGSCNQALFTSSAIDVGVNNFDQLAIMAYLRVVVVVFALWCCPCKVLGPQFEQAAKTLEPRCRLVKVNTQVETTIGQKYQIRSIPTMVVLHRGQEIARKSGAMSSADIVRWVESQLGA